MVPNMVGLESRNLDNRKPEIPNPHSSFISFRHKNAKSPRTLSQKYCYELLEC
jgi:hypothetical protein